MDFLPLLLLYLAVGASCFYLIMCADPNKSGPIAFLHRFLYMRLPAILKSMAPKFLINLSASFFNYICYKNHPIIQIMYLGIVIGGFILYMWKGFGEHFPNRRLSNGHIYMAFVAISACLWIYYKVCSVSPGIVTKSNNKYYLKAYPKYDGYLFLEKNTCKTCDIIKPARSKHCRVCNVCVAKFDHHCVWVRQCIGEKNYKYFLLFILSHCLLCLYATYIGTIVFYGIIQDNRLMHIEYQLGKSGERVSASVFIVFQYLFHKYTAFVFIVILCVVMGITLALFFIYHCTMIAEGVSTNERIKKSDITHAMEKELKLLDQKIGMQKDNPDLRKELEKEKKDLTAEYNKIENLFEPGFRKNVKLIASL